MNPAKVAASNQTQLSRRREVFARRDSGQVAEKAKVGRFGNHIVERDGLMFDSKAEAADWAVLQLRERAGEIRNVRRQVPFELQPAFRDSEGKRHRAITHVVDFVYEESGRTVALDTKGHETATWQLKHKLFLYVYPEIRYVIRKVESRRRRR